ncbi:MAG: molybdopterin molybdotransferase MoeA [Deltaproteobacteria bacterium]|nr:molybdopterin molybdotransferase MoeA [Deltaproteobacteria bacterium]
MTEGIQGNEFLKLVPPLQALKVLSEFGGLEPEAAEVADAVGRVLAESVVVPHDYPPFDRATVDGYAVRSLDVQGASNGVPATLESIGRIEAGRVFDGRVGPGQALAVPTGGVLPRGADAVVMVEDTAEVAGGLVEVYRAAGVGRNVLHRGEDAGEGQILLVAGTRLRSHHIGALCGLGIGTASVVRRPVVGVLATGNEIVSPDQEPGPGQIRDVNQHAMAAAVESRGWRAIRGGIVPDRLDELTASVAGLLSDCDVVLLSGGSSVGVRDLTATALERLGGRILFHGVAVKPGRPTICAMVNGKPVFGMPGHPVSSAVSFELFVAPLLRSIEGEVFGLGEMDVRSWPDARMWPTRQRALLARRVASVPGRDEFIRVRLRRDAQDRWMADPVPGDSSVLTSVVSAHGLVRLPAGLEGLEAGSEVEVLTYG